MPRLLKIILGLVLSAVIAMGFGWLFCWWSGLQGEAMADVLLAYGMATGVALVLFPSGQLLRFTSHAYFIVTGAAVFLVVDFLVWHRTGVMPAARLVRGGFVPAAIMGLVIGVLYRVVAVPTPVLPRDPRA